MLETKIIICILTFATFFITHLVNKWYKKRTLISCLLSFIAVVLGIMFCTLLVTTNNDLYTIPKITLFITMCLYLWLVDDIFNVPIIVMISIGSTALAFTIAICVYIGGYEKIKTPYITTNSCKVVCTKNNLPTNSKVIGNILYVQSPRPGESVYQYYYQLEGESIKLGTIPADDTTLYFIGPEEEPRLETIVATTYLINKYDNAELHCFDVTKKTYKLYVPEHSVTKKYKFYAD